MNKIVVFDSKRGSTEEYAKWIAEELDCRAVSLSKISADELIEFDLIIYGGWLRGSGIVGYKRFCEMTDGPDYKIVLFTTGISEYNPANYAQICEINFPEAVAGEADMRDVQLFFCPGRYDPVRVRGLDKLMMRVARSVLKGGKMAGEAEATNKMLRAIDKGADYVDKKHIEPILRAVRKLENQ